MSEEKKKSVIVGRLWKKKDDDGGVKGYGGSISPKALAELPLDEYGNVRVWVAKNSFERKGKKDCDLLINVFLEDGASRPAAAKKSFSKPAAKPAPAKEDDDDFL